MIVTVGLAEPDVSPGVAPAMPVGGREQRRTDRPGRDRPGSRDRQAVTQAVFDETRGRGIDMWVEASGAPGVIETAMATLARNGTTVLLGLGPHLVQLDPVPVIRMGTRIQGSMGHSGAGAFGSVIRLMPTGRLDMTRIVTTRVGLDGAVGCLEELRGREAGKCMVVFS